MSDKPKKVKGGRGNFYVHQRGAAPVAYPSKRQAKNATKSLRNAKVSKNYQSPANYSGQHSTPDSKPGGGCWLFALAGLAGLAATLGGAGYGVVSLIG